MKRKRGPKPGERKGKRTEKLVVEDKSDPNFVSVNTEDNKGNTGVDCVSNFQSNFKAEIEVPTIGAGKLSKSTDMGVDRINDRPTGKLGHGRVRVKLRSSKSVECNHTSSEAQTHSDTDKSNSQMALEKHEDAKEKMEDSVTSLPETKAVVLEKSVRKAGSIKIKSSKGLNALSATVPEKYINKMNSPLLVKCERSRALSENEGIVELSMPRELRQRQTKQSHLMERQRDQRYNEKELSASLTVIKKIMKMDAAEPFNAPVNPVALGIPDYLDIIDTPMDFGTICHNLEVGKKYNNSEDVFTDVQFIWENCHRYNNKGDYILDLMKRVKKNFTKHWVAAGLSCVLPKKIAGTTLDQDSGTFEGSPLEVEHERSRNLEEESGGKTNPMTSKQEIVGSPNLNGWTNGIESPQFDGVATSSQEKVHPRGNYSKQKTRRRFGISHHKSDCLCAVCVARRRRQEREGNAHMIEEQTGTSDTNLMDDFKQEENNLSENPCSEDEDAENLSLDHSQEPGAQVKLEAVEQQEGFPQKPAFSINDTDITINGERKPVVPLIIKCGTGEESNQQSWGCEMEESGSQVQPDDQKEDTRLEQPAEEATAQIHEREELQQEVYDGMQAPPERRHCMLYNDPLHLENPSILQMFGNLFSRNPKSVWSGPHSLVRRHVAVRDSPIHAAMAMFMK